MLRKFLLIAVLYSIFNLIFLKVAWGSELVAGQSAEIEGTASSSARIEPKFDMRPLILHIFFAEKNSILKNHVLEIIKIADLHNVDYRLFPAISGVESGYCKAYIEMTNNCVGWGGGYIPFKSIDEQIETVVKALRENYINDGLLTVDQIGARYAADPTWSYKVKRNMSEIEKTSIL